MKRKMFFFLFVMCWVNFSSAQTITAHFVCKERQIDKTIVFKTDPILEDDPEYLQRTYAVLSTESIVQVINHDNYDPKNVSISMVFPSHVGDYQVTFSEDQAKNNSPLLFTYFEHGDSLRLSCIYNKKTDPSQDGLTFREKSLHLHISRYDNMKGGKVEGSFDGVLIAHDASSNQYVRMQIDGTFSGIRSGENISDENRNARPAEEQAIIKLETAIRQISSQWAKNGWIMKTPLNIPRTVEIKPKIPGPMMPNSENGGDNLIELYSPTMQQKMNTAFDNAKNVQEAHEIFSSLIPKIEVKLHENVRGLKFGSFIHPLHIPNVPVAYEEIQANGDMGNDTTIYLAFGNWKINYPQKEVTNLNPQYYTFKHPKETPYIENVLMIFTGNMKRIREILQTTNWELVTNALTQ